MRGAPTDTDVGQPDNAGRAVPAARVAEALSTVPCALRGSSFGALPIVLTRIARVAMEPTCAAVVVNTAWAGTVATASAEGASRLPHSNDAVDGAGTAGLRRRAAGDVKEATEKGGHVDRGGVVADEVLLDAAGARRRDLEKGEGLVAVGRTLPSEAAVALAYEADAGICFELACSVARSAREDAAEATGCMEAGVAMCDTAASGSVAGSGDVAMGSKEVCPETTDGTEAECGDEAEGMDPHAIACK